MPLRRHRGLRRHRLFLTVCSGTRPRVGQAAGLKKVKPLAVSLADGQLGWFTQGPLHCLSTPLGSWDVLAGAFLPKNSPVPAERSCLLPSWTLFLPSVSPASSVGLTCTFQGDEVVTPFSVVIKQQAMHGQAGDATLHSWDHSGGSSWLTGLVPGVGPLKQVPCCLRRSLGIG